MILAQIIEDCLAYCENEKGYAKSSNKGRKSRLRHLHTFMVENGFPLPTTEDLTLPLLRRYMYSLNKRGLRPRSIRGAMYFISTLTKFAVDNGLLDEDPIKSLTLPKFDAAQRLLVSDKEIAQLLEGCEKQRSRRKVALSRAILSTFVYSGLRRGELLDLRLEDVNLDEQSILVRNGKGSKSRKIYICREWVAATKEWLFMRGEATHDYVFAENKHRRVHDVGLKVMLEEVKAIAGLADRSNILPHTLRHACATRLMRNGADLRSIQAFLGHSSLIVTSVYLHTNEEQLRDMKELGSLNQPKVNQSDDKPSRRRITMRR